MKRPRISATLFLLFLPVVAGIVWWLTRSPVPGPLKLQPVRFADLPGWASADPRAALAAFRRSCGVVTAMPAGAALGSYGGKAADWRPACAASAWTDGSRTAARAFFETRFAPLQVLAGEVKEGLFTGYYEPQLAGSRTPRGRFRVPVYGLPSDLVTVDLGRFPAARSQERIAGRMEGARLVPYATRAQIDAAGLATAPVLFYGDDPVAVFFLHIQGSGRVVFDDGQIERIAYAGQNGWPYTAIGRTLIREGAVPREAMSMQAIRDWLRANPARARKTMESNASFVFFRALPIGDSNLGSPGAENVPLTPGASIAVDAKVHPLGVPFFVTTRTPDSRHSLNRLFVAQDTGGAIRGPLRADIFFGFGPDAEADAGRMKQPGRLYVLLPKAVAARAEKP
jgi:membrane-bound lytic murein transglycosylase A